jgi:hypothetical protein
VTYFQQILNALGFSRFKLYRRWIGGRWAERYIEPTPHSSECPHWRWVQDPGARFDDETHVIEQWTTKLPTARGRYHE